MTAVILIPAIAAVVIVGAGFLTLLVMPLIGMRTEGSRMRQSSAHNTRAGTAARLILGVYVRDQSQEISVQYDDARSQSVRTIQAGFREDRCPCGALIEQGAKRCRKCRARTRWYRRKSRHDGL